MDSIETPIAEKFTDATVSADQQPGLPIFVDLDGTLARTDVAQELFIRYFKQPTRPFEFLTALLSGPSHIKRILAETQDFSAETLPYNETILNYLRTEKRKGRRVYLASATDKLIAEKIADHLQLFDGVIASSPGENLKGSAKLDRIREQAAGEAFEYIGDSDADIPIWDSATQCGFVNTKGKAASFATKVRNVSVSVADLPSRPRAVFKAIRPHQWAKNFLIFAPLLFSHSYTDPSQVMATVLAFLAFSACASAIYIVNDLFDVEADRVHHKKKFRPFAAGTLQPIDGALVAGVLITGALIASASLLPFSFLLVLLAYIATTTLYSTVLKHYSTIDVITLTCLYTVRLIAGAAAISVELSPWLLNFSLFFFLSLAYMKRYIELKAVEPGQKLNGRNYSSDEVDIIAASGLVCGGLSILTLSLYLNSEYVKSTYSSPTLLWLICPLLLFWVFRCWLWARRGKIDDDPVVFALRDRISLTTAVITGSLIIASKYVHLGGLLP
ncbi:MAG: UbiA family prenyltransferase [Pseudomonadota bacterium]